jgi:diadenosine tetraphosphate (Ap4A) HIT family hydrolase
MVAALETAETYRSPSGIVSRRVALLPTSVAVIGNDQYYRGYTLVIARRHARELYHLSDGERTAYFRTC